MEKHLKNSSQNKTKYIYKDKDLFIGNIIDKKELILNYLKSFTPNYATSAFVYDYVTKNRIDGLYNMGYEYGGYFWSETDIYHFEKYNMPLKQEFIEYVLSK